MSQLRLSAGFTLIELLVVVAIIAILSTIALPNFLEAQTRSKVARVKNDLRTMATALETYAADNRCYPPSGPLLDPRFRRFKPLTTPIPYLSKIPLDPFESIDPNGIAHWRTGLYAYGAMPLENASRWIVGSDGPDRQMDTVDMWAYTGYIKERFFSNVDGFHTIIYDPTNGSVSRGDVLRANDFNQ